MGRHLYVVLGMSIQAVFAAALLEETKICPKDEGHGNGGPEWLDTTRTRRENSDLLSTTSTTNSQDACFPSCLATIEDPNGLC